MSRTSASTVSDTACLKTGNQIIDGRNRYRATQKLKIKCRFDEWDGKGSLTEISCSLNFHRRHLTPSQRAATGAIAEEEFAKEADVRRKAGKNLPEKIPGGHQGEARELAAKACGVNARYISDAKAVRQHDAALFAKLVDGSVTITVAAREVHRARKRAALKAATPAVHVSPTDATIITGDILDKLAEVSPRSARCVFFDPPYNIGIDYGKGSKADQLPALKYLAWCEQWMSAGSELLTPDGSLWVMINDEWADEFGVMLKRLGLVRINWIKWYETFGCNCTDRFNRTSRHLHFFGRDQQRRIFDRKAVNRPSLRQSKYDDKRAVAGGKNHDDVWEIPRLVDNDAERVPGFPTQVPMEVMRRVIGCCTEPGDLVVEGFAGSGTGGAVSIDLGRRYIGIEQSKQFSGWARERLARQAAALTARSGK